MGGDNSNEQSKIQQMGRRSNTNSQSGVQQSGKGNSNSQLNVQQHTRRANMNSQSGVQQSGNGNSNKQESIQQYGRRANMNSQTGIQQMGNGNSNKQDSIQQYGRRNANAMILRDCPPFLDPSNCYSRRMIGSRSGNSNVQKQVQQYGGDNSNSQSGVQQYGRRFSVVPEQNDQYQFGGSYEPVQPVVWGGPDAFNPNSEYGIEGVGIPSYPELTLPQQNGVLGSVYGSYRQGQGGSPWGSPISAVPDYYNAGYGNNLAYGSLGMQYQQPSGVGYIQSQSPYGRITETN